jgi:hypothetical protein
VTHNPSRKQFFAKLLGVVAATSVFPKLFAKSASPAADASLADANKVTAARFEVRHDQRAVARRETI